jgi:hypothetical protein
VENVAQDGPLIEDHAAAAIAAGRLPPDPPSLPAGTAAGAWPGTTSVARVPGIRPASPEPGGHPIIPLVHAPDDPGPDAELEPAPEPTPQEDGWRRLAALFRS